MNRLDLQVCDLIVEASRTMDLIEMATREAMSVESAAINHACFTVLSKLSEANDMLAEHAKSIEEA